MLVACKTIADLVESDRDSMFDKLLAAEPSSGLRSFQFI